MALQNNPHFFFPGATSPEKKSGVNVQLVREIQRKVREIDSVFSFSDNIFTPWKKNISGLTQVLIKAECLFGRFW